MSLRKAAANGIITLIIGGAAFTISQSDVAEKFAAETGMTREQAAEYVANVGEDDLVSFGDAAAALIAEGRGLIDSAAQVDCENYDYEWQGPDLPCPEGKRQIRAAGENSLALGRAYGKLGSDSASDDDIREAIRLIDSVNADYDLAIFVATLDPAEVAESKRSNSYNKALLQAALESR